METVNDECVICKEKYNTDDREETQLPCKHVVCRTCVFEMCKTKMTCPFCREDFQVAIQRSTRQSGIMRSIDDYYLVVNNQIVDMSMTKTAAYLLLSIIVLSLAHLFPNGIQ